MNTANWIALAGVIVSSVSAVGTILLGVAGVRLSKASTTRSTRAQERAMVQQMITESRSAEIATARDFLGVRAYDTLDALLPMAEERQYLFRILWLLEQINSLYDSLSDDLAKSDLRRGLGPWCHWCALHLETVQGSIDPTLDCQREMGIVKALDCKLTPSTPDPVIERSELKKIDPQATTTGES